MLGTPIVLESEFNLPHSVRHECALIHGVHGCTRVPQLFLYTVGEMQKASLHMIASIFLYELYGLI